MNYFKFSDHTKGLLYALCTSLCWGVLAILLKNALEFATPKTIISFRMIFAFILSLPFVYFTKPSSFKILKKPPLWVIIGSLGLAFNYLGFMNGVALSGASNAQIMIQTGPLALMIIGFFLYKEPLKKVQLFWLLISFIGFGLFFKDQLGFIEKGNLLNANMWILGAAFSWVGYSLMVRHFTRVGRSSSELNLIVFLTCSIILSFGLKGADLSSLTLTNWILLLVLGLNTLLAYGCFGAALKYAPASQVSVIITANPILTLLIISFGAEHSKYIPNEPISLFGYFGALFVVTGIIFSTLASQKKTSKKAKNTVVKE